MAYDSLMGNVYTDAKGVMHVHDVEIDNTKPKIKRLGDYIYEAEFDSLKDDINLDISIVGGCSAFVQNNMLYRNFDWKFNNLVTFKVKTKDFIGCALLEGLEEDKEFNDVLISQLPYHIVDGRNKYGIMISSHVVYNDWNWKGTGDIPFSKIPYLVLSNVTSMEHIEEQLGDILNNLYANKMVASDGYIEQFLITDGSTSCVILPPESSTGSYVLMDASDNPKMTNFRWVNNSTVVRTNLQNHPSGVERFNSMPCSMKDIKYTLAYQTDNFLSEFIGINDTDKYSTDDELKQIRQIAYQEFIKHERNGITWQTMHSSTYGKEGLIHLFVQEDFNTDYGDVSTWNNIQDKPFETVGDGLIIENGVLKIDTEFITSLFQ